MEATDVVWTGGGDVRRSKLNVWIRTPGGLARYQRAVGKWTDAHLIEMYGAMKVSAEVSKSEVGPPLLVIHSVTLRADHAECFPLFAHAIFLLFCRYEARPRSK